MLLLSLTIQAKGAEQYVKEERGKERPRGGGHPLLTQKVLKQWLLLPVADFISHNTFLGVVQQPWLSEQS